MDDRLQEIVDRGSPAQAALARELQARPDMLADVAALYDAYLHDPYLTRN